MRFFLFWATCFCTGVVLSLGGCATTQPKPEPRVAQVKPVSQQPSYVPPKRSPVVASVPLGQVKVAILLPLTGENAALGQAMLNAAQQAVFDVGGDNFELQPHDTAVAGGAGAVAQVAIAAGAQLIIGPLFAVDVAEVRPVAERAGLQMLPLSTDTSLAERGVYVMGLAPNTQVDRVVAYASLHGAHRFAALVQDTPYGALVSLEFRSAVAQRGGVLVDMETCAGVVQGCVEKIKILGALHGDIDSLFLPESGVDLKKIADQLTGVGFDPLHTRVLGTGLWDVAGLGKQSPLLTGGWYAAPDPALRRGFITSYAAAYGAEPPRLATLAYDATALAAVLVKRGVRYNEDTLTNPNGFAGLDGIFRLTQTGTVERGLAVNEVTVDGAHVVDPAPVSFVGGRR